METWFSSPARLWDVTASAAVLYLFVVVLLRAVGKRAASKQNNFDWVVTVAVGAITSSAVILEDVSVLDAMAGVSVLVGLQYVLHRLVVSNDAMEKAVLSAPTLLLHKGQFLEPNLRAARVSKAEVFAALRAEGIVDPNEAQWVLLEPDASLSVIPRLEPDRRVDDVPVLQRAQGRGALPETAKPV